MSTTASIPEVGKAIVWRFDTLDYDAYLNGQYIGSFPTYPMAEAELNRLALEQLRRAGSSWSGRSNEVTS